VSKRTLAIFASLTVLVSILNFGQRTATSQSQPAFGYFNLPGIGFVVQPFVPVTISWSLDNPAQVDSQDLILSTDGGATFLIKIAAHMPPQQTELKWGPATANATPRAKLKLALLLKTGAIENVFSEEFSILAVPKVNGQVGTLRKDARLGGDDRTIDVGQWPGDAGDESVSNARDIESNSHAGMSPEFASPGSCTSAELPMLYYNMDNQTACATYDGEPALAQDPTDPNRYFTITGPRLRSSASPEITSTSPWAYSGTSSTRNLDFGGLDNWGDNIIDAGADGAVYAISLASQRGGTVPDRILIFRSKDHGSTFEPGVVIPNLETGQFLDKPVIAVNPLNAETLVMTYNAVNFPFGTRVAICKQASTGNLADASIWGVSTPKDQNGIDMPTVGTTHPLIDPIDSTSYRLFVVQTNCAMGQETGYAIHQYQLTTGQLSFSNAVLDRLVAAKVASDLDGSLVSAPRWNANSAHQAIEDALRLSRQANYTKAALDYCDPNAHRMYIPTLVDTRNNANFNGGLSSDLFLTVWQYTGTESAVTKRILPGEGEKYVACAVTDGHGRVWVMPFIIASTTDIQRAQHGVIAINRRTGDPGAIAYSGIRLPANVPNAGLFLGDYIYTQASFYPDPNNPGNVNGLGSRVPYETFTDTLYDCSSLWFRIEISGWI